MTKPFGHVMLDFETMGVGSNAVIASIGAVLFNLEDTDTEESIRSDESRMFYKIVDMEDCIKRGLIVDASTVYWWLTQSEEARKEIGKEGRLKLPETLNEFSKFVLGRSRTTNKCLWGNGADFDNVILKNAYQTVGLEYPFTRWASRCFRTMKGLVPKLNVPQVGTSHNALDDAIYQVLYLQEVYKKLQKGVS